MEKWKKINETYSISTYGNVKNDIKGLVLKSWDNGNGYLFVGMGRKNKHRIHRLVAYAFIPNPLKKDFINHIDGNKYNNHINNLEWCTRSENMQHAWDNGLINANRKKGKEHHKSICVYCTDKHGNFIQKYDSCTEASLKLKGSNSLISQASRGVAGRNKNSNKAYGFYWSINKK
jgi:hypothetical protein